MGSEIYIEREVENSKFNGNVLLSEEKELIPKRNHRKLSRGRKIFFMVACMMQQLICNGIGYGLSVMYAELIIVFEEKRSKTALIQSIYMAIATGGGILFTGAIIKVGPGRSMMVGSILGCIGLFLSSFSESLTAIILCTGVVASLGMCVCYLSPFIAISRMFHEDAGLYLVMMSLGSSIGQFIVPIFYEIFIELYAWSGAFILMAGIALQNLPFGVYVHYSKRYFKSDKENKKTNLSTLCDFSVLKDWLMWLVYVNFHLIALTGNFEAWFLVDISISRGFTRESGSILITVLGFANVLGRLLGGVLRFNCTNILSMIHWIYLCPVLAVGHVLIVNINNYWGLFACCIMYGIPFGVIAAQPAAIILEITSLEKYPQAMALANVTFGLANIISGQLGGFIRDTLGDYDLAFYIAAIASVYISLTTGIAAFVLKRRKQNSYKYMSNLNKSEVLYESLK